MARRKLTLECQIRKVIEAGKRNSSSDKGTIRSIVRQALSLLNQDDKEEMLKELGDEGADNEES